MKRFVFRLERLLELRRQAERQAEQALAESRRLSRQRQDQLAGTQTEIEGTCAFGSEAVAVSKLHAVASLQSAAQRLELLRSREATESRQVAEAERQVAHRHQELLTALRARRGLTRLRQRRRVGYQAEALKAEDAARDEAATVRFGRRSPGPTAIGALSARPAAYLPEDGSGRPVPHV